VNFFIKRLFDITLSFFGLLVSWWIILIAWIIASIETKSNGFFIQKRVGKNGKIFDVCKIKTMNKANGVNTTITLSNDVRITKSGKFFRDTKIDELPQLYS
jgi:lipopolysaccharide/colanic/teichoic acid biosynthesis glycosyltransferase